MVKEKVGRQRNIRVASLIYIDSGLAERPRAGSTLQNFNGATFHRVPLTSFHDSSILTRRSIDRSPTPYILHSIGISNFISISLVFLFSFFHFNAFLIFRASCLRRKSSILRNARYFFIGTPCRKACPSCVTPCAGVSRRPAVSPVMRAIFKFSIFVWNEYSLFQTVPLFFFKIDPRLSRLERETREENLLAILVQEATRLLARLDDEPYLSRPFIVAESGC